MQGETGRLLQLYICTQNTMTKGLTTGTPVPLRLPIHRIIGHLVIWQGWLILMQTNYTQHHVCHATLALSANLLGMKRTALICCAKTIPCHNTQQYMIHMRHIPYTWLTWQLYRRHTLEIIMQYNTIHWNHNNDIGNNIVLRMYKRYIN